MPSETDIKKMKRGELNQFAATYGINPDDYSRADDLRSALFEHLAQQQAKPADAEIESGAEETSGPTEEATTKPQPNPPRPRIERRSKRYRAAHEQIDKSREYTLEEAVDLVQKTSTVNFDAAVELHVNLGVDPKQSDQLVRDTVNLPHGSGKSQTVAALAPETQHKDIKQAGADIVGYQDVLDLIEKGNLDFDILVAHPDAMKDLSQHAKVLGPQGLMPSPKAGTVTEKVADTVRDLKAGRVEYRVDRYGNVHQIVGRVSFTSQALLENIKALHQSILGQRPGSLKGSYIQKLTLTSTMGPSVKLDISSLH